MKIKQTIVNGVIAAVVATFVGAVTNVPVYAASCGGATTSIISCSQGAGGGSTTGTDTGVWGLLLVALNIMTAGVGIAAVGGVVYASILYASSSDSAEQTKKAKDIIRNVAIGIIAYAAMYLALNYIIPGGIFS